MKRKIICFGIIFMVFALMEFVCSADQSVNIIYENQINQTYSSEIFSSSIILKVNTFNSTSCRYSTNENFDFDNGNNFDSGFGTLHKKELIGLSAGVHNYYIKCYEDVSMINITFLVNPPISGKIVLSKDAPLKMGRFDVTLVTSKTASFVPELKYSFDGVVYNPLTVVGSGNTWRGYIIIDKDVGEGLVSFKFKATDLEGREGTEITEGAVYSIDTIKPKTVSAINAEGYNGGIDLEWHLNEEFDHFNIYRSEHASVSYTDYYTLSDDEEFRDSSVVEGKTYYYKVSAVDDAGNEGDLSIEVYATPSLVSDSNILLGLSLNLRGEVDSLLNEIDFSINEVKEIESSISSMQKDEKELFSELKFDLDVKKAIDDLNSLRNDVEKYKQQDLTKEALDNKISSSRLKIDVIKKKIPESIIILNEGSKKQNLFTEEDMRKSILEFQPLFDENQIKKTLDESNKLSKERGLEIVSSFYVIDAVYSDGSKKKISIVKRDLNSQFDKSDGGYFIELIPKDVIESASDIDVQNQNYDVIKDDPVLSFDSDTKRIFYSFEGDLEIDNLKDISINYILPVIEEDNSNSITGYFFYDIGKSKYTWFIFGGILLLGIIGYLFYKRRNNFSDNYFSLLKKIKDVSENRSNNSIESLEKEYGLIRNNYNLLLPEEKKSIYPKVQKLHDKVFVRHLEKGFVKLKTNWDRNLFLKLEKIYNTLSEKNKKKLEKVFLKIKRDAELKELEIEGKKIGLLDNSSTLSKNTSESTKDKLIEDKNDSSESGGKNEDK